MKKIVLLLLMLLTGYYVLAQKSDNAMKSTLDTVVGQLMATYMKDGKRVGISIGVDLNGKSFIYNYGETAPGSGILPSDKSIYKIGSITKTFTGLLVAHAITEGRIALNDDIRKFLPGNFPNLQYPNGDPVKIGYLLAHTAQFPNSMGEQLSFPVSDEVFLKFLNGIKLDSLRSFRYVYSNVGYQLLGFILEKIYHKSYEELVSKYITIPLGMTQTKVEYGANSASILLKGYGAYKEAINPMPMTLPGAGGLSSSVRDMLKYLYYQNMEKSPEVRLTHRLIIGDVDKEAYGFQWAIGKNWNWDQYIRTDGGINGFRSFCVMYPLQRISIVILSNQKDDSTGLGLYKVAMGIYATVKKTAAYIK